MTLDVPSPRAQISVISSVNWGKLTLSPICSVDSGDVVHPYLSGQSDSVAVAVAV